MTGVNSAVQRGTVASVCHIIGSSTVVLQTGDVFVCAVEVDALLSVQCISSIGQIIKSVCVSVSQSVSELVSQSVTQNELNALQIAIFHRSSPNLPPR